MVSLSPRLLGFIFWYTCLHALSVEGCGEPDVGVCFLPLQAVRVERIVGESGLLECCCLFMAGITRQK